MSHRKARETSTRSSSTPPWFAQNCRSPDRSEVDNDRGKAGYPGGGDKNKNNNNSNAGSTARDGSKRGLRDKTTPSLSPLSHRNTKEKSTERSGDAGGSSEPAASRTPQVRNRDPDFSTAVSGGAEMERPEGEEDFVEGGVELSPPHPGIDPLIDDDVRNSPPTRPLLEIEDRQLEEFWPHVGMKALFLDYDGTLREFEAKPEMAVPTEEISELLAAINARPDFQPHIISGRNASFLEAHFGHLPRFTLVAEHGFQIWRAESQSWSLWDGTTNHDIWKSAIRSEMSKFVSETPGSHLEEKASSLVWHYREVANQVKAEEKSLAVIARLGRLVEEGNLTDVRISHGHKIVEASYGKVRKGPVMRKLCEEKALFGEPYVGVLVAGDDVSDESMFDAAPSDYLTIKVGQAETSARSRVDSPADLRAFLKRLLQQGPDAT